MQNKQRLGITIVLLLIGAELFVALAAPLLAPHDPYRHNPGLQLHPPLVSTEHILGTDNHGRDIYSRLLFGTRSIMLTVAQALLVAVAVGVPLGLAAGVAGWALSLASSILFDSLLAVPPLLLALTAVSVFSGGAADALGGVIAVVVGIIFIPVFARQVRHLTLEELSRPYLLSVRTAGGSMGYIVFRHVIPAIAIPLYRLGAISAALIIAISTTLTFLGIGASPPGSDWGLMLRDGRSYLLSAPWMAVIPGVAVVVSGILFQALAQQLAKRTLRPTG